MSEKNASIKTLFEDLKISFKFAGKNIINFLLAMIGVILVSILLLAAIAAVVFPLIFLTGGLNAFIQYVSIWIETYQTLPGIIALLSIFIFLSPLIAPFLVAFGALYGMGREIVESEGTTAEGVFSWYSKKFLSLAGGGLIQFFIIVTPIAIIAGLLAPYGLFIGFGPGELGLAAMVLAVLLIYLGFMSGLLSMVFPAIIDGNSVIDSLKISLRLSTKYFDRIFSTWFAYLGIFGALMAPIVIPPILAFPAFDFQVLAWLGIYSSVVGIFTALVFFPAVVIGMSRIYMILVSEHIDEGPESSDEIFEDTASNDVSLFGGE